MYKFAGACIVSWLLLCLYSHLLVIQSTTRDICQHLNYESQHI